jgi:hypothetical protein
MADLWHYPRMELAEQVLGMFDIGLTSALTFFAPRRMGKTEFLRKDVMPLAEKRGWQVHYYSFLDADRHSQDKYMHALCQFAYDQGVLKHAHRAVKKIGASVLGIGAELELEDQQGLHDAFNLQSLIKALGDRHKTILLLDEVQALSHHPQNAQFIASLRTALDVNKDTVKVLFTGSSREGLKKMFSRAQAPFFHFGQNLDLPHLEKPFTDFLCDIFHKATQRQLDKQQVWQLFQELEYVPQLVRAMIEKIALNPGFTIDQIKQSFLNDLYDDRSYMENWHKLSQLEKVLLRSIATEKMALYSKERLAYFSKVIGIEIKPHTVQSALRSLIKKGHIIRSASEEHMLIEDPNFSRWIQQKD